MENKFNVGITLFFLFSFLILGYFFFTINGPENTFRILGLSARADEQKNVSAENSLIFSYPISVPSDGNSVARVAVFLRDNKSRPVEKQLVKLRTTLGNVQELEVESGPDGKAEFTLVSATSGVAEITAIVNNTIRLTQTTTVEFTD